MTFSQENNSLFYVRKEQNVVRNNLNQWEEKQ